LQSLGAAILSLLDPNHQWKPEKILFSLVGRDYCLLLWFIYTACDTKYYGRHHGTAVFGFDGFKKSEKKN
jgi:hypothetical protein